MTLTGQIDWSRSDVPYGPDPPDNLTATLLANGAYRARPPAR